MSELTPRANLGHKPLTQNHEPKGWGNGQVCRGAPDRMIEIVHHEEEDLEFLDFYGEKSYGDILLRSKRSDYLSALAKDLTMP